MTLTGGAEETSLLFIFSEKMGGGGWGSSAVSVLSFPTD